MEKYGKWENSSTKMEVDDEESDSENDNIGVGRTYECHYCKRGFTNAQALGGHMNIHRKDKAKARQQQQQQQQQQSIPLFSYPSSTSYKPFMDSMSTYPSFAPQRNSQEYYPFANNNNNINGYFSKPLILEGNDEHDLTNRRSRFFDAYENQLGSNLSLRMTSSSNDQYQRGKEKKNKNKDGGDYNDIDLELRLGYDR